MKYNAKKVGEKYAVHTGRKYFPHTVCNTLEDAQDKALIMSAQWYRNKIDDCQMALEESGYFERQGRDMDDLLC